MDEFRRLGNRILERAKTLAPCSGALQYADLRIVQSRKQELQLKNEHLVGASDGDTCGFGLRVLVDGFWGFSSHHDWSDASIESTILEAIELAKVGRIAARDSKTESVKLAASASTKDRWKSPCVEDPFQIALPGKIEIMRHWIEGLRRVKGIQIASANMAFRKEQKLFLSSEGSDIEQEFVVSGMGYSALATDAHDAQVRSFPNSVGGQYAQRGFELLKDFDFLGEAERVGEEAVALLRAPQCPQGVFDIILDSSQLGLQIHESCGHPIELDRVLGWEANYAGRSFLTPEKFGAYPYGSAQVSIIADSLSVGGLGTFGYDDEGTPAGRWNIIDKGNFVGYLTSRETAPVVGLARSQGTMRAEGWNRLPLIRMVNVSLEPGQWDLNDLFAATEGGLYLETNRSWSIDELRYNFQFGTEAAWEIKGGKKGRLFKNATYQGITPEFWSQCDAICNDRHWKLWGVPNCGKGEPGQLMGTGHGAAPARFRKVTVGMGYEAG